MTVSGMNGATSEQFVLPQYCDFLPRRKGCWFVFVMGLLEVMNGPYFANETNAIVVLRNHY